MALVRRNAQTINTICVVNENEWRRKLLISLCVSMMHNDAMDAIHLIRFIVSSFRVNNLFLFSNRNHMWISSSYFFT